MKNSIPLSLYVHLPWCIKKCPYCDFNSHEKNHSFDEKKYLDALLKDLDEEYQRCQQRKLSSIFFGGGTPSLFSANSIQIIIEHAKSLFGFTDIEITLEANPGTFEQEKFNDFYAAGINRLSIGVQSFNETHLKTLGRIHDQHQAFAAIQTAKTAGFENINVDLMFGLPRQTIAQAINDITTACELNVPHISHYQLTIEENTYFHKHTPTLPENDLIWEMQTQCQNILRHNQYHQYEISAYSLSDKSCAHNLNYWQFGDYIGIGAGAHGKITETINNKPTITRRWKYRQPQQYMDKALTGNALSGTQQLEQQDIVFEFLLNALRLKSGCEIKTFTQNTGLNKQYLLFAIKDIDPALLQMNDQRISTTGKGYAFLNNILESLLVDELFVPVMDH